MTNQLDLLWSVLSFRRKLENKSMMAEWLRTRIDIWAYGIYKLFLHMLRVRLTIYL